MGVLSSGWFGLKYQAVQRAGLGLARKQRTSMRNLHRAMHEREQRLLEQVQFLQRRVDALEFQIKRLLEDKA